MRDAEQDQGWLGITQRNDAVALVEFGCRLLDPSLSDQIRHTLIVIRRRHDDVALAAVARLDAAGRQAAGGEAGQHGGQDERGARQPQAGTDSAP